MGIKKSGARSFADQSTVLGAHQNLLPIGAGRQGKRVAAIHCGDITTVKPAPVRRNEQIPARLQPQDSHRGEPVPLGNKGNRHAQLRPGKLLGDQGNNCVPGSKIKSGGSAPAQVGVLGTGYSNIVGHFF